MQNFLDSSKRHNANRKLIEHTHFGQKVLINPEPFKLAKIGEKIENSILLPKRYVPAGVEFEPVEFYGRLRGRTLYVLLDKPIIVNGIEESIINIKGAGADWKNRRMLIDLSQTCVRYDKVARSDMATRPWGGVVSSFTQKPKPDFNYQEFFVPDVAINQFPQSISEYIAIKSKTKPEDLAQIVRVAPNTVRLDEFYLFGEEHCIQNLDVSTFIALDARLIETFYDIRKRNQHLIINGLLNDNRYPNGKLTDLDGWQIRKLDPSEIDLLGYLPAYIIAESLSMLPTSHIPAYITGMRLPIPILNNWFDYLITNLASHSVPFADPFTRFDDLGMVNSLLNYFEIHTRYGSLDQFGRLI